MTNLLDRLFPLRHIRNIALFYVLSACYNLWFVAGVWVFIWGRFMTKTEIGISDVVSFSIGFLFELPSGVIADLIGRKKAIIIGNLFMVAGNILLGISSSFWGITVWYVVWTIGYAFQSGSTEALAYDTLKKLDQTDHWPKVIATSVVVGRVASLVSTALGGFIFTYWFRLPYLTVGVLGTVGIIAAYLLHEIPITHKPNMWSFATYFNQIKDGVSVLVKPQVISIALISLTIASAGFLFDWGLLRPLTAERFGYTALTFPLLLTVRSILFIIVITLLAKIRKIQLEKLLFFSTAIYALTFFVSGFNHTWIIGGLLITLLTIAGGYVDQLFSTFINIHTRDEHRATTLSAVALFTRLPYLFLAFVIAVMAQNNELHQALFYLGGVCIVIWLISLALHLRGGARHDII